MIVEIGKTSWWHKYTIIRSERAHHKYMYLPLVSVIITPNLRECYTRDNLSYPITKPKMLSTNNHTVT